MLEKINKLLEYSNEYTKKNILLKDLFKRNGKNKDIFETRNVIIYVLYKYLHYKQKDIASFFSLDRSVISYILKQIYERIKISSKDNIKYHIEFIILKIDFEGTSKKLYYALTPKRSYYIIAENQKLAALKCDKDTFKLELVANAKNQTLIL